MKTKRAVFAIILAGALWGIISIFIRLMSEVGLGPMEIAAIRMVVSGIVFSIAVLIFKPSCFKIRLRDVWMFIGTGIISVTLFNFCYFQTIIKSQASVAVVLLYTSPIFVMLLSALLFKEKITLQKVIAVILTFVGCILVAGLVGGIRLSLSVILTGLGSGVFYALYTIFGRIALRRYDSITVTVYTFIFGTIGTLPFCNFGKIVNAVSATPIILLSFLGIGVICTVIPYFLYTGGLQRIESGRAAILVAVEPLVGAVVGMVIFHEDCGIAKLSGIALIIISIIIMNINLNKKKSVM